jgi:hypothetical protein
LEHVGLQTAVAEVEHRKPLKAARQLHRTFDVEVADVTLAVPLDEHTETAVQVVGFDAAVPKYPDEQAVQLVPVKPVLQVHMTSVVTPGDVELCVPAAKHTVTAVQVVGLAVFP